MTMIAGKENVDRARLLVLRSALGLEIKGMGRRGRSAYAIIKSEFGFTGNRQKVWYQLDAHIKSLELNDTLEDITLSLGPGYDGEEDIIIND